MSIISKEKYRLIYIYQTLLMIEHELKNPNRGCGSIRSIVQKRIIDEERGFDLVLYRLMNCYIPAIVKENMRVVMSSNLAASLIKQSVRKNKDMFPNGISMKHALGKDTQGVYIWNSVKRSKCVKNAINYTKIKSSKGIMINEF